MSECQLCLLTHQALMKFMNFSSTLCPLSHSYLYSHLFGSFHTQSIGCVVWVHILYVLCTCMYDTVCWVCYPISLVLCFRLWEEVNSFAMWGGITEPLCKLSPAIFGKSQVVGVKGQNNKVGNSWNRWLVGLHSYTVCACFAFCKEGML